MKHWRGLVPVFLSTNVNFLMVYIILDRLSLPLSQINMLLFRTQWTLCNFKMMHTYSMCGTGLVVSVERQQNKGA